MNKRSLKKLLVKRIRARIVEEDVLKVPLGFACRPVFDKTDEEIISLYGTIEEINLIED